GDRVGHRRHLRPLRRGGHGHPADRPPTGGRGEAGRLPGGGGAARGRRDLGRRLAEAGRAAGGGPCDLALTRGEGPAKIGSSRARRSMVLDRRPLLALAAGGLLVAGTAVLLVTRP